MKTQQGKFVLFSDILEFANWLDASSFSRVIRVLQCHHTYVPSYKDFHENNHFQLLRSMEAAHLERGFAEIAQNLTTFPDGSVAVCRAIDTVPAGVNGANKNGICVENLGNFDKGCDSMTPQHRNCIVHLYALLYKRFNLHPDPESIVFHHWYDLETGERTNGTGVTKTCPGTNFFDGNTVQDAVQNFIPLLAQQLEVYSGSAPVIQAQPLYTADVQVDTLNVRAQPSLDAVIVKQLTRGVEVPVYEEENGWRRINPVDSQWVYGPFLASTGASIEAPELYVAQVNADLLNVRILPSLSASIADQITRGTNVYVYEESDGWCKIDPINSLWVGGRYLRPAPVSARPAPVGAALAAASGRQ